MTIGLRIAVVVLTVGQILWASASLDERYTLKNIISAVTNIPDQPVYGEHIEGQLARFLKGQPRFEFSEPGYALLKEKVKGLDGKKIIFANRESLSPYSPVLTELAKEGVDAVVFAELQAESKKYNILLLLVATKGPHIIHYYVQTVDNPYSLDSFSEAILRGGSELLKGMPFDATVLNREGYRVIIDRGKPDLSVGMELPTYTLEQKDDKISLEETGKIVLTQVEDSLSFGKIVLEKKPSEVLSGNKIKIPAYPAYSDKPWVPPFDKTDKVAFSEPEQTLPKRRLGYVDVQLGASFVTANNTARDGSSVGSDNVYFPGGSLRGELWITRRLFADFGFRFSMSKVTPLGGGGASVSPNALNSTVNDIRGQVGYRFSLSGPDPGPSVHLKAGFARYNFSIDASADRLALNSSSYSGMLIGGGGDLPVAERLQLGFDVNALLFASMSESPLTSGELSSCSGWDFILRGTYRLNPAIDIDARVIFQANNAEFTGAGTRAIPLASASHSTRQLLFGMSYYF
ncbi:MAG: hypothetical protein HY537_12290 [Deltaproteobacteria bacterium]|nr:hypothetical protein [Deltaproteobacteria bacterium]